MYSPEEVDAIVDRRLMERARDEREKSMEEGFTHLQKRADILEQKVEKANNLKQEIVVRLDKQDVQIAEIKQTVDNISATIKAVILEMFRSTTGKLIAAFISLYPLVMALIAIIHR